MDKRILRTKAALKKSLLDLLRVKTINTISVKELCSNAGINRSTFYAYYKSPEELLESMQSDFIAELTAEAEKHRSPGDKTVLVRMLRKVKDNSYLMSTALDRKVHFVSFLESILYIPYDECIKEWERTTEIKKETLEYIYTYMVHGAAGILEAWLKSDMGESPEELAEIMDGMIFSGVEGYIHDNAQA